MAYVWRSYIVYVYYVIILTTKGFNQGAALIKFKLSFISSFCFCRIYLIILFMFSLIYTHKLRI